MDKKPEWYILAVSKHIDDPQEFHDFKSKEELNDWLRSNGQRYGYMKIMCGYTVTERGKKKKDEVQGNRVH